MKMVIFLEMIYSVKPIPSFKVASTTFRRQSILMSQNMTELAFLFYSCLMKSSPKSDDDFPSSVDFDVAEHDGTRIYFLLLPDQV